MSQESLKARLKVEADKPANNMCVECGTPRPTWAILIPPPIAEEKIPEEAADTVGAFVCYMCSGHHRSLGTHICFVRSVTLDDCKFMYAQ